MSGETKITPGYVFNEQEGERLSLEKLNRIARDMVVQVLAGSIGTGELADKAVTADKLDADVEAQLGVAKGSVTTGALADGFILPISKGGTSASTADTARESLGIKDEILTVTAPTVYSSGSVSGTFTHVVVEDFNSISGCSISTGEVTFGIGTYHFDLVSTLELDQNDGSGSITLKVINISDDSTLLSGISALENTGNESHSTVASFIDRVLTFTEEITVMFKTTSTNGNSGGYFKIQGHIRKLHVY